MMSRFIKLLSLLLVVFLLIASASVPSIGIAELQPSETQQEDKWQENAVLLKWCLPEQLEDGLIRIYDKLNDDLYKKTGAAVNFILYDFANYESEIESLYASGDDLDIVFSAHWLSYFDNARRGYYYPIDSMLDRYAPKTKADLGASVLKSAEVDGELFALPVPGQVYAYSSGIKFRKDLVDKFKINLSNIKRLEDVEPVLKLIKAKQPNMIPLVNTSTYSPLYDLIGFEQIGSDGRIPGVLSDNVKDNSIYNEYESTSLMAHLKTLNKFYKAGYIESYSYIDEDRIFSKLEMDAYPIFEDYAQGDYSWVTVSLGRPVISETSATGSMHSIWYDSKNPELSLKVIECINSDPSISNLIHFGVEGEDYIRVSENVIDKPKKGSPSEASMGLDWILGNKYLDYTWKGENPDKNKILRSYNDRIPESRTLGFMFDVTPVESEMYTCKGLIAEYGEKLLSGQYDPVKYIPMLNDELKRAGIDKLITEKQKQLDVWLEDKAAAMIKNTSGIRLILGGKPLTLKYPPAFSGNVPMAPMKQLFDSLDAISDYNAATKKIIAKKYSKQLELILGDTDGLLDGNEVQLDASPSIINGQVYIPVKSVCTLLGYDCKWNVSSRTLQITGVSADSIGTSWGNLSNRGLAVADENDQYFSMAVGIYRLSEDGAGYSMLNYEEGSYMNLDKDWLYYSSSGITENESNSLCKMKRDGSSRECLLNEGVSYINLLGEWLYYVRESDSKPYRMHVGGQCVQKLSDFAVSSLHAADGWLYFLKSTDKNIYKMRTSGTDIKKLTASPGKNDVIVQKKDDWIYYYGAVGRQQGLYKMKTEGTGKRFITDINFRYIGSDGTNVYYNDHAGNLYLIDETAKERIKVGYGTSFHINICGDWVYYTVYGTGTGDEYRISRNGTIKQKVDSNGKICDVYRLDGNNIFAPAPINIQSTANSYTVKTAKEIAASKDAVVQVGVFDENGNRVSSGSGFNIDAGGIIVTNFHVIAGAASIKCTFENGKTYDVDYVLNYNILKDIAILRLKSAWGLPVVRLGDSSGVELADDILAIGSPFNMYNSISDGIVSGIRDSLGLKYIQITAPISAGSSGGPLFDCYGNVIGVTTMTLSGAQNMNFAIPINTVKRLFSDARRIPVPTVNNYDCEVIEFEGNNRLASANDIYLDNLLSAALSSTADTDVYKFSLASKGKVTFSVLPDILYLLENESNHLEIKLLDRYGTVLNISGISEGTQLETLGIIQLEADLNAGTYYISVSAREGIAITDPYKYNIVCAVN